MKNLIDVSPRRGKSLSRKQRTVTCPKCGFEFSVLYARAFSCQSCSRMLSSLSCEYIKCPKCGFEFQSPESAARTIEMLRKWGSEENLSGF